VAPRRVAVGMSGGVDSSVAALLAIEAGHKVEGVTMTIYGGGLDKDAASNACYGPDEEKDVEDARAVCAALGIPHRVVDLREEYSRHVLTYFRDEYLSGRTPNPCIRCNQLVKFGMLVEKLAGRSGTEFDLFATGHYAKISFDERLGRFTLRKASDPAKDQSYFLCMLSQDQLRRAWFPLGGLSKSEVRRIARERGLCTHDKPDSQNFASGDYRDMLGQDAVGAAAEGPIKDSQGKVLGSHRGIGGYTVGQRRGLGIGGGEPLYVTAIDKESNTVFAGPAGELYRRNLLASRINWASVAAADEPLRAAVRIRYQHREAPALVTPQGDGSAIVLFDEPQKSIAAGQWAVFYHGDLLLGGGVIERSW
jgi:tRNA-specific 2-thiouridylase